MQEYNSKESRGRTAIQKAHEGLIIEDENRLNHIIAHLYAVDRDEASEIHTNYHADRIFLALTKIIREKGIAKNSILSTDLLRSLDLFSTADQVAKGRISEAAAIDILFRTLKTSERQEDEYDRYISFYR
jgi:hypothetical protein